MTSPAPQPASPDERNFTDESLGFELFWAKNKQWILSGAVALVVLGVAAAFWILHRQGVEADARRAFALAASAGEWEAIAKDFPGSVQAANARLLLAQAQREAGDLRASSETYEEFLRAFPGGQPLESLARIGLAENAAAAGKTKEALELFRNAADSSQGFGAQIAMLSQAQQLLMEAGGLPEAKKSFETIITEFPDSFAARVARSGLEQIALILPPGR